MPRTILLALAASLAVLTPATRAFAQFDEPTKPTKFEDVGQIGIEVVPAQAKPGQTVTVKLTVTPKSGAWTYPAKPKDTTQRSVNSFPIPTQGDLIFVTPVTDPPIPWKSKQREGADNGIQDEYFPGPVTWEFTAVVSPKSQPGKKPVIAWNRRPHIQVCDKDNCFPARSIPTAELEVLDGDPVPVAEQFRPYIQALLLSEDVGLAVGRGVNTSSGTGNTISSPPSKLDPSRGSDIPGSKPQTETATGLYPPKEPKPLAQYKADLDLVAKNMDKSAIANDSKQESIGAFVLTAILWGLISLVTPCVFPMIPITVSIFLKHAHGSFGERLKLASVYCLTIIFVLGLSAFALLRFMAVLSANPITNVLLGALFLVLALSLFGMFELTLPNFMARRLQSKQAKGGVIGMIFGALAFTVISFTCVAPFLGGFAGISAADSGNTSLIVLPSMKEVLGGLAFATAFAAPFFVLAMIPGLLKALPRSGGWLDSVKVVMGFLELAAALKFFRTAELRGFTHAEFFTYDLVLAGWVGIAFACGLYLLNAYRLPHDEEKPSIGVPRLVFALVFLGLGVYLLPAMFKGTEGKTQRPGGAVYAWVDAFLLPEPKHLGWGTDLPDAIARVRAEGVKTGKMKPIILDFTGVTCTNCSYNENTIFPQAKVNDLLDKFERVQLYTDVVPADLFATDPGKDAREDEAKANDDFKFEVFRDQRLPLYATLVPTADGKVKLLGVYKEGKINSPEKFAAWLKESLEKAKK